MVPSEDQCEVHRFIHGVQFSLAYAADDAGGLLRWRINFVCSCGVISERDNVAQVRTVVSIVRERHFRIDHNADGLQGHVGSAQSEVGVAWARGTHTIRTFTPYSMNACVVIYDLMLAIDTRCGRVSPNETTCSLTDLKSSKVASVASRGDGAHTKAVIAGR